MREHGISLGKLNIVMLIVAIAASGCLFVSMQRTNDVYRQMHDITQHLINWKESSSQLQEASDYLTEQIRCYAITGELKYLDNYFNEANVTRRRDHALEKLGEHDKESVAYQNLKDAMDGSVELMTTEYKAARLTALSKGFDMDELPEEVKNAPLTQQELDMDENAMNEYALELLFGDNYNAKKNSISVHMQNCLYDLSKEMRNSQIETTKMMERQVFIEHLLTIFLMLLMIGIVLLTFFMVIKPLQKCVELIRDEKDIPIRGAYEIRFLAKTYNLMYNTNLSNRERLTYAATHDKLTGLYNRRGYDFLIKNVDLETSSLVLFDVDNFKEVNDGNGHDVGDKVLKRVSETIFNSFRSQDYICRIGGDEFTVIMVHADSQLLDLMKKKIEVINESLKEKVEGEPTVSLSAGMAFGRKNDTAESIFKEADEALYQAKEGGRKRLCFYGMD